MLISTNITTTTTTNDNNTCDGIEWHFCFRIGLMQAKGKSDFVTVVCSSDITGISYFTLSLSHERMFWMLSEFVNSNTASSSSAANDEEPKLRY